MELYLKQLTKKYGDILALDHFETTLKPGIIGLLGANGSGKTTLLRILSSVLTATQGKIYMDGVQINPGDKEYLSQIGYMPQHLGMYPHFKVEEFLDYIGAMKGLTKAYRQKRIPMLLKMVHLENVKKRKIKTLSGGMKQRLGIAQALINDPDILILDEPTAGLDPKERNQFSRILSDLSKTKIILISTHIVSDVEAIANSIILLKEGKMIAHDCPDVLLSQMMGKVKEKQVNHQAFLELSKTHIICTQKVLNNEIFVRYIDNNHDTDGKTVEPTLNDLYLYYFGEVEA